jgi:phosphate transport system substrate-binding protein
MLMLMVPVLVACGGTTDSGSATTNAGSANANANAANANSNTSSISNTNTTSGSNASVTAPTPFPNTSDSGQLTIAGSSALLPLIQAAAQQFQQQHPNARITVTAGGSGAGRTQVCQGKVDIGNSDVPLSADEQQKLNCASAIQVPVAIQAFAPVANRQGPGSATSLTKQQLQDIFSGKVTNWKDVGGDDQQIVLINRAKGSGTRANMAKFLFGGDDTKFATGDSEEDNSETVKQTVAQTPGAISYLGFAYLQDPGIASLAIDGITPTKENIQSGKWPIGGPGYAIITGDPTGVKAAFLNYVISPDFQNSAIFSKLGFVPLAMES